MPGGPCRCTIQAISPENEFTTLHVSQEDDAASFPSARLCTARIRRSRVGSRRRTRSRPRSEREMLVFSTRTKHPHRHARKQLALKDDLELIPRGQSRRVGTPRCGAAPGPAPSPRHERKRGGLTRTHEPLTRPPPLVSRGILCAGPEHIRSVDAACWAISTNPRRISRSQPNGRPSGSFQSDLARPIGLSGRRDHGICLSFTPSGNHVTMAS
jgi:hypothetical protein